MIPGGMIERFRIIDGGKRKSVKRKSRQPFAAVPEKWEHYKCGKCTDELGFPFTQLHEVRIGTVVTSARGTAGKVLDGQIWLACPRCHQLRFQVRKRRKSPEDRHRP